jgi:hypothetical protein
LEITPLHREGFPCSDDSLLHACQRHYPGGIFQALSLFPLGRRRPSPKFRRVSFRDTRFEACSAFTRVPAYMLAKSPFGTLYTEDSDEFVTSFAAPIATGWNDQLPGGIEPHWESPTFTAY